MYCRKDLTAGGDFFLHLLATNCHFLKENIDLALPKPPKFPLRGISDLILKVSSIKLQVSNFPRKIVTLSINFRISDLILASIKYQI